MIMGIQPMKNCIYIFFTDRKGASAIEYGVLIAFIALIMIAGFSSVGTSISNLFNRLQNSL